MCLLNQVSNLSTTNSHALLPSSPLHRFLLFCLQPENKTLFQANGLACQAKYVAGSIPSYAANASLFVKAHAY